MYRKLLKELDKLKNNIKGNGITGERNFAHHFLPTKSSFAHFWVKKEIFTHNG